MSEQAISKREKINRDFTWVVRLANLLDNKFSIGGFRFGLDPILNFFPVVGQIIAYGISVLLVVVMFRNGVSSKAAVKMLLNVIVDAVLGSIPIVGNVFDFFSKANQRNITILQEYYYEGKHQGSAKGILTAIFLGLLLLSILLFYLLWVFGKWVIGLF